MPKIRDGHALKFRKKIPEISGKQLVSMGVGGAPDSNIRSIMRTYQHANMGVCIDTDTNADPEYLASRPAAWCRYLAFPVILQ